MQKVFKTQYEKLLIKYINNSNINNKIDKFDLNMIVSLFNNNKVFC